jgi:hypothetical protein
MICVIMTSCSQEPTDTKSPTSSEPLRSEEKPAGRQEDAAEAVRSSPTTDTRSSSDQQAWIETIRVNTISAYESYTSRFENGEHVTEAVARIEALRKDQQHEADKSAWGRAVQADTRNEYQSYLTQFPSGAYALEAKTKIELLDSAARKKEDQDAWNEALRQNDIESFRKYIQNFNNGAYAAAAQDKIVSIEKDKKVQVDESAWTHAEKTGTVPAFEEYLRNFPKGNHVNGARRKLGTLRQQSRNVPTIDEAKTCRASAATIVALTREGTVDQRSESCRNAEQKARHDIVKNWATYTREDKDSCVQKQSYLPSYIEWLTCLEMRADVRKLTIESGIAQDSPVKPAKGKRARSSRHVQ